MEPGRARWHEHFVNSVAESATVVCNCYDPQECTTRAVLLLMAENLEPQCLMSVDWIKLSGLFTQQNEIKHESVYNNMDGSSYMGLSKCSQT